MEELHFQQLDETLYHEKLDNGLSVYILPKKGFSKTYVTFTTKYGSIDRSFVPIGKNEPVTVPDGIAHFLEHKMFEKEEGDVFQQFSQYGASANAFTSFTRTAYLFSATDHLYDNTETLLNFVQEPYFTEKTVEKEKGIIGQEITMYDDNPDWRLYYGVIENMFKEHPVKIDIAGTIESIDHITAEHLYECYHTFYHPSNMLLFIVGAVDPNEMIDFVKKNQNGKTFAQPEDIERIFPEEPKEAAIDRRTLKMDVQKPKMFVGLKAARTDLTGSDMLKNELSIQLAMDLLFNRSSNFYTEAYEKGWIDESFAYDFTLENGFGFAIVGSDTSHPEELEKAIKKTFKTAAEKWPFGLDELNRARRKRIGQFLRSLNSLEFMANQFTRYAFNEMDLFEVVPILEKLTVEDLQNAFTSISGEEQQTVFTIMPSGMNEHE